MWEMIHTRPRITVFRVVDFAGSHWMWEMVHMLLKGKAEHCRTPKDHCSLGRVFAGSHWMWEMVHMLLKGKAEHCRTPKERLMLSFTTQEFFDTLDPPRVFNNHVPFAGLPAAIRGGHNRCKMVYLLRNPKDVAVSFYHQIKSQTDFQYEGSFHGYLDLFCEGKGKEGIYILKVCLKRTKKRI